VVFYIDKVGIRTSHRWTPKEISLLRQHCGKPPLFGVSKISYDRKRYWTRLFQPNDQALQLVSAYEHNTSHFEPAMDILVRKQSEVWMISEYFRKHSIQRWQGKQEVITHENTRYSAQVHTPAGNYRRGVNRADYCDRLSKVTRTPCVHIELRYVGAQTIQRITGVTEAREFPHVDPVELFRKGLLLAEVDLELLGREYENRLLGQRRRKPKVSVWGYNYDRSTGSMIYRHHARVPRLETRNTQAFVSSYGRTKALRVVDLKPLFINKQNSQIGWQNNAMISMGCKLPCNLRTLP
jgi:hypothetical protein